MWIDGVLTIAEVVEIIDLKTIVIEYISENGNTKKKTVKIDEQLKGINPQDLSSDDKLNQLAGIINIGTSTSISRKFMLHERSHPMPHKNTLLRRIPINRKL